MQKKLVALGLLSLMLFSPMVFFLPASASGLAASFTTTSFNVTGATDNGVLNMTWLNGYSDSSFNGTADSSGDYSFTFAEGAVFVGADLQVYDYTTHDSVVATFEGGTTTSSSSTSTTTTTSANTTGGWGTQVTQGSDEFVNAVLDHNGSGWKVESPGEFVTNSSTASANYSYYTQDLTSLDWEYQPIWSQKNIVLNPQFSFTADYEVNVSGYVFKDIYTLNNGFYGVGGSQSRKIVVTIPNGTTYTTDISKYEFDYVRYMILNESVAYYFLWTVTPQPITNIQVFSNNAVWAIPISNNLAVNISLSVTSSNMAFYEYSINQNFSVSQGVYPTNLAYTSNPTGSTGIDNAILQTLANPFQWIGGQIAHFIKGIFTNGFNTLLNDLGLGWVTSAMTYFVSIVLIMFVIIESIMPYLGFILLLMNVYYVVGMDFDGLMNFYMSIYSVVSTMASALIGFATLVYDFFSSLFGGGSGELGAAAVAA